MGLDGWAHIYSPVQQHLSVLRYRSILNWKWRERKREERKHFKQIELQFEIKTELKRFETRLKSCRRGEKKRNVCFSLKLRVSSVCWICYCFHSQIVNSFFAKFQATTKSDVWGKVARIALWLWIPAVSIKHVYRFGWPLNVSFRLRLIRNIHLMKRRKKMDIVYTVTGRL